jgi:acetylornithine deacetylase/succinyl-diaminopimelate desuccinylase-like protein
MAIDASQVVAGLPGRVRGLMPKLIEDLIGLVEIPSVRPASGPLTQVLRAGEAVVSLLKDAGIGGAHFLPIAGSEAQHAPLVYADHPCVGAPADTPTVLLYAHYDVQPAGEWTDAFKPREADGRLFGRGAADDKSGIIMHLGAIRAFDGKPPVHLKVVIEGEEETGEGTLEAFVSDPVNRSLFRADVVVVADVGNWAVGLPTLTTTLRGLAAVDVTVRTLNAPVHSGVYGGPAPDAFMALVRILAALHDAEGNVAVPGLRSTPWTGVEMTEEQYREDAGVVAGVDLIGTGSVTQRLYTSPALSVVGLDGVPPLSGATNALRDQVTARVSLRLAPRERPSDAMQKLRQRLEAVKPWHVDMTVTPTGTGEGYEADPDRPAYATARAALEAAYPGTQVRYAGEGGSIPLVNRLADINPGASIILWGCEDPAASIHGPAESVDLGELEAMTLAEAGLLARLAPFGSAPSPDAPRASNEV